MKIPHAKDRVLDSFFELHYFTIYYIAVSVYALVCVSTVFSIITSKKIIHAFKTGEKCALQRKWLKRLDSVRLIEIFVWILLFSVDFAEHERPKFKQNERQRALNALRWIDVYGSVKQQNKTKTSYIETTVALCKYSMY